MPNTAPLRIATARHRPSTDPRDATSIHAAGAGVRALMTRAAAAGARLVHFGEGALCTPSKRLLSSDPDRMAAADWTRFAWAAQDAELRAIAEVAASLRLWTVLGATHRLTGPHRPYNSLYVIDDHGRIATRYDERMLSRTKLDFLYTPGTGPITVDVDGVRFGCALGMESQYPECFAEYERSGVHAVLLSTMDNGAVFAVQAQAHASTNSYWISYATTEADAAAVPSGIADPSGAWVAQCPTGGDAEIAVADLDRDHEPLARPWRRAARTDAYATAAVTGDPRERRDAW